MDGGALSSSRFSSEGGSPHLKEDALRAAAPPAAVTDQCPRRKTLQEHALWDEMLLYAPGQETAFSLNAPAKAIWELCDGQHSLAEVCRELGRRFCCPEETLWADVRNAVVRLQELGLLEGDEPITPLSEG